ncbi:MAG: amino acid ABC transporter permease [Clostridiales bacterium]|nr:amino acid ABC transporter permease [Clostridiales bacterium]
MDFTVLSKFFPLLLSGVEMTLLLTLLSVGIGVILGLIAALMRMSHIKILRFIGTAYIEIVRGTPLMVQVYLIFFGFPQILGFIIPPLVAGVISLGFNSGAYVAEIIRAGIQAVDIGQTEAAYSLGMNKKMNMQYIIIPQAVKNILPALVNEFITLIKESSVVSVIGLTELTRDYSLISSVTFRSFEPLLTIGVIYFIMTFTLSKFMGRFERRLRRSDIR